MMVVLVLPAIAAAAGSPAGSYTGTYTGVATGKNDKGKKGSSGITVWVQVNGDQTTFTFRVDGCRSSRARPARPRPARAAAR